LHGDVLMWLMKTLLTSRCINQRGAGQNYDYQFSNRKQRFVIVKNNHFAENTPQENHMFLRKTLCT
ncbi:hypothetical protein, partial [Klebsiella pneumoniae]|uniref:hypothetical protein n=1 Tax=Klebsiella pneumoniae TaxID=573 RepID=UPI0039C195CE